MASKNIILLSDGTGNAASKIWRTNVWRLFQALDLSGAGQVAAYDDGVGTSSFKPLAILGGAFGWGLKRNVLDLYEFLCRNYKPGDQIYGFGFSRGAFTIRVLMGLVGNQGLVTFATDSELQAKARLAYRAYRASRYHSITRVEVLFRFTRDFFVGIKNKLLGVPSYNSADNIHPSAIHFIGVWDTVAAYGLPVDEMTHGVSRWLWPLELPDRTLSPKVTWARHAIALDDERTTFHPVLWTEQGIPPVQPRADGKRYIADERLSQVWFVGVHSNVGGGYPDDSLANVSLYWMMREAKRCGLIFKSDPATLAAQDPDAMAEVKQARDKDGRLYDSRQGLGGYYRYGPRKLDLLTDMQFTRNAANSVKVAVPKIHESVLARGLKGAHAYAPIGLPATYDLVLDSDEIVDGAANTYESAAQAINRANAQEDVWNLVWWRRVVYFATVAASLHLALFPLFHQTDRSEEFKTPFRLVSETLRLVGVFIPNFFDWWLHSYAANPGTFVVSALLVAVLIWLGTLIGASIANKMTRLWHPQPSDKLELPSGFIYWLRTSNPYQWVLNNLKRRIIPFVSVVGLVYAALTVASHVAFNIGDAAGVYCKESASLKPVPWLGEMKIEQPFRANDFCWASGVEMIEGRRYQVIVTMKSLAWKDGSPFNTVSFDTDLAGFEVSELNTFSERLLMTLGVPLRRVFLRPWFRLIGRVGGSGTDEYFMDHDQPTSLQQPRVSTISPAFRVRRSGEFFMYVNDAALAFPGLTEIFYKNNSGEAEVTIKHLPR